ncbi:MAG: hypothetical protein IT168_29645 [Bryobacterales bacterium]|nr:hypothetical protein [Bryobacterales bacterium]
MATPDAATFLSRSPMLAMVREVSSQTQREGWQLVAQQLEILLRDYYVHLPLKRSSLGIDPVQEARLLADDVRFMPSESDFHRRIFDLIKRMRDRHTAIRLPSPWRDMVAFLPFAVESYFDEKGRHLIVSKLTADVGDPQFVAGVKITHWNGTPIQRFIEDFSWTNEGANPFARIAVALRSVTVRPLGYMAAPGEDWVAVTYVAGQGYRTVVIPWRVYIPPQGSATAAANVTASEGAAVVQGVDRSTLIVNSTWRDLYSDAKLRQGAGIARPAFENVVSRIVKTAAGDYGYIRIFSFDAPDTAAFINFLADILKQMPASGLILDLRSNPGGSIPSGESILGLLTKGIVTPQPVSFRNSVSARKVAGLTRFRAWQRSLEMQLETGETFSQGFPLTVETSLPKGVYLGKVVAIIDALCYSTTDFLTAGLQDHGIATLIGTDPVTGAGGANVWNHGALQSMVAQAGGTDIVALPGGYDIDVSMRRSTRVGPNAGLPVEGLGVFADYGYNLTRRDVLGSNEDLIEFAGNLLSTLPAR